MKVGIIAATFLALIPAGVPAQTASASHKTAVKFSCTCEDTAGAAFATAFRDLLATSPRYSETSQTSEKLADGKDFYNWQIRAVSIDPSVGNVGESTAISVVFLLGDTYFVTHVVQICGRSNATVCASNVLASFDKDLNPPK